MEVKYVITVVSDALTSEIIEPQSKLESILLTAMKS